MSTTIERKAVYHTTDARKRLGISAWSIRRLIRDGKIPYRRMQGERTRYFWLESDIEEIEAAMFCGGSSDEAGE
jgi:predicted site-specific integrase-resolvase